MQPVKRLWRSWFTGFQDEARRLADAQVHQDYEQACREHGPDSDEAKALAKHIHEKDEKGRSLKPDR